MKKINREKILQHGFKFDGENFVRRQKILDASDDFTLEIIIDARGNVTTKIFDADGEPYTLHLVEGAAGKFVGAVKFEHEKILSEVAAQCFDDEKFFGRQTNLLVDYISEHFNGAPEFLWEKYPTFAIFRNEKNRKWYALIAGIPKKFLRLGEGDVEILNVRIEPEQLDEIVDDEKYFRGWHMNKRSWLTVRLDETLTDDELFMRLENSFKLAAKK